MQDVGLAPPVAEPARVLLLTQPLPVVGADEVATGLRDLCGSATLDADTLFDAVLAGVHPPARSEHQDRDTCVRLLVGAVITVVEAYRPPALVVPITATNRYGMEALAHGLRTRGAEIGHVDVAMSEPVVIERARLPGSAVDGHMRRVRDA